MARVTSVAEVRGLLLRGEEIALLDVREEGVFADAHPLWAASLPLGRLELEVLDRVPRLDTPVVVYDAGEGLAERAAERLGRLGYTEVSLLAGGLEGWRRAGGELFRDVNVPSKAFGELVDATRHTPSVSAGELRALLDAGTDLVVLDARRTEEYRTMSIPTGQSVPGAELVWRVGEIAPRPETMVVVNCAGRTRSIIGAQSLVNAGVPNRVAALRNGTIGWTLAGLELERGQTRVGPEPRDPEAARRARGAARAVADRAGVGRADLRRLAAWLGDRTRTTYRFDVRTPEEYEAGHLPGFRSAPGGQLVQETDVQAPVRGARIVLRDDQGARADMTASWLAQMGWEVHVLDGSLEHETLETGPWRPRRPSAPAWPEIGAGQLAGLLDDPDTVVADLASSPGYLRSHVPGAWLVSRTRLEEGIRGLPRASRYVLTSPDGELARWAAPEMAALLARGDDPSREAALGGGTDGPELLVLAGGTDAWREAGGQTSAGPERLSGPPSDVYKRPYEGTDNAQEAMEAYLEWEYGLVAQLERDGTHGFRVI